MERDQSRSLCSQLPCWSACLAEKKPEMATLATSTTPIYLEHLSFGLHLESTLHTMLNALFVAQVLKSTSTYLPCGRSVCGCLLLCSLACSTQLILGNNVIKLSRAEAAVKAEHACAK